MHERRHLHEGWPGEVQFSNEHGSAEHAYHTWCITIAQLILVLCFSRGTRLRLLELALAEHDEASHRSDLRAVCR